MGYIIPPKTEAVGTERHRGFKPEPNMLRHNVLDIVVDEDQLEEFIRNNGSFSGITPMLASDFLPAKGYLTYSGERIVTGKQQYLKRYA